MTLKLYKNKSANNVVFKDLQQIGQDLNGVLREECSVMNPVITIEIANPTNCNYVQIVEFNRYYYITDMVSINNNLWQLTLHVDVLYTYRNKLQNLNAVVKKQELEKNSSLEYNDGSFTSREDNFIEIFNFSGGFNDTGEFILLTAGAIES